ncbi:MAG: hypothetical protein U1E76_17475 [Planctomycetota bacterium]
MTIGMRSLALVALLSILVPQGPADAPCPALAMPSHVHLAALERDLSVCLTLPPDWVQRLPSSGQAPVLEWLRRDGTRSLTIDVGTTERDVLSDPFVAAAEDTAKFYRRRSGYTEYGLARLRLADHDAYRLDLATPVGNFWRIYMIAAGKDSMLKITVADDGKADKDVLRREADAIVAGLRLH